MFGFTVFQILADVSHALSILILLWTFFRNRSAEGVSLLTQILYLVVFVTRYTDLFGQDSDFSLWLFCFKIFFITSTAFTIFLMLRVFARTRERELAWKLAAWSVLACLVTAPFTMMLFNDKYFWTFSEYLFNFSLELESVCILPQLLLLRQTSVPTVLDSYYLVALGSYRALYIPNWIVKGAQGKAVEPESVIFGVIQTLLYLDFAWVYYSRQRVKLRGGSVVDSDDYSKSYLVRRIIGTRSKNPEDDEIDEYGPLDAEDGRAQTPGGRAGAHWGARGISVSADDTLNDEDTRGATEIVPPSHFEDDDDDADAPAPPAKDNRIQASHDQQDNDLGSSAKQWSRD